MNIRFKSLKAGVCLYIQEKAKRPAWLEQGDRQKEQDAGKNLVTGNWGREKGI